MSRTKSKKAISRAELRGKKLDFECYRATISKYEYGPTDNRCFCYGLYEEWGDTIRQKCIECKAFVDNATPPED